MNMFADQDFYMLVGKPMVGIMWTPFDWMPHYWQAVPFSYVVLPR